MTREPKLPKQEEDQVNFELERHQLVTFAEFNPATHSIEQVKGVEGGALVEQLANVFGYEKSSEWTVERLSELIGKIGPAKELQENLPLVSEILPGSDGKQLAIEWVNQSGLLEAVSRNYANPNALMPEKFEHAAITGGVRNWMMRRAILLIDKVSHGLVVDDVILVAGNREMKATEGPDVIEGDTEASYQERVIKPLLEAVGLTIKLSAQDTKDGEAIATAVAQEVGEHGNVLVVCNAGNWPQNGGQIDRALGGGRTYVESDSFPVAENNEPPATHQNPLTAVGILARDLQEFKRHSKI